MPPRNHVAERVRELLVDEGLRPGDRLPPERELAATLGLSRSRLREGLRRLSDLGVIEARQGSGTYLAPVDLGDLLEVRLQIEPLAARLAAERRSPEQLAAIVDAFAEMEAVVDDAAAFGEADVRAHAAIVAASGSLPVRVLFAAISDLLRHSRATTAVNAPLRDGALTEMTALIDAIGAQRPDDAEAAMLRHLTHVGTTLPT